MAIQALVPCAYYSTPRCLWKFRNTFTSDFLELPNKQTVIQLLEGGKAKPFIIPEYQRPYAWTQDEVDTLFHDLWDFAASSGGSERDGTYFLVFC